MRLFKLFSNIVLLNSDHNKNYKIQESCSSFIFAKMHDSVQVCPMTPKNIIITLGHQVRIPEKIQSVANTRSQLDTLDTSNLVGDHYQLCVQFLKEGNFLVIPVILKFFLTNEY